MSASGDDIVGSLTRVGVEAAKLVRRSAEQAAEELSGALGADQVRWPGSGIFGGPVIPEPYKHPGQGISWQDGYMASCVLSVARTVRAHDIQPVTAALVAVQATLHTKPEGYRLLQVGLNAHRVLGRREWRRLGTSLLVHADLPHLASNCTALALEGLPLEARLGSVRFAGLLASTAAVSQGLYLLCMRAARDFLPRSSLADDYFHSYTVGFSGVALALRVVAGYMREADLAAAHVEVPEEFILTAGRLAAWPSLLLSHYLLPTASLPAHLCGIAAGVLHVYGSRLLTWLVGRLSGRGGRRRLQAGRLVPPAAAATRLFDVGSSRHPGLGWMDLGSHVLLGAGTVLITVLAARQKNGGSGRGSVL